MGWSKVCLLRRPVGRYVRRGATRGRQGTFETRAPRRAPRGGRSCCTVLGCRPITIDKPQASETDAWRGVQCLLSYRHRDLEMPPAYSTDDRRNGSQARPASRRRPGDKYGNGSHTPSNHMLLRVLRVCVSSIRGGCTLEAVARDLRHVPRSQPPPPRQLPLLSAQTMWRCAVFRILCARDYSGHAGTSRTPNSRPSPLPQSFTAPAAGPSTAQIRTGASRCVIMS
jgi:hypothetical protein